MRQSRTLRQLVVALALLVAFLVPGNMGTGGNHRRLVGQVTDDNGAPLAGAAVKAASASQTVAATTDAADISRSSPLRPTRTPCR